MKLVVAAALLTCACGRIGYDAAADDQLPRDSGTDAQAMACASAIPVSRGVPVTISTCTGNDFLDACGPAGTEEVVFVFTAPITDDYLLAAYDTGTMNISNSTSVVNAPCDDATSGCAGLVGRGLAAGEVIFFAVEAAGGGCATIDFLVE